jgi:hypothetical protein
MDLIAEIIRLVHRAIAVTGLCAAGLPANAESLGTAQLANFQRHAVHKAAAFGRCQHRKPALAEVFNFEQQLAPPPVKDWAVNLAGNCLNRWRSGSTPALSVARARAISCLSESLGIRIWPKKLSWGPQVRAKGQEFCYNLHISCSYHLFFGEN